MATVYINPNASPGGSGASLVDALDSWPASGWAAGNVYVQLAGTTYNGTIAPNISGTAGSRIFVGSCDHSGAIVRNGEQRAIVIGGSGQHGIDLGSAGTRNYFDICSLDVSGGPGTSRAAIFGLGGVETTVRANTITYCRLTAQNGAACDLRGDTWQIKHNHIFDSQIDGIFLAGLNFSIESNVIANNDAGLSTGDGIQVTVAASVGTSSIRRNTITHSTDSSKQGILVSGASGSILIECNLVNGGGQSAYALQVPGCIARRNVAAGAINAFSVLESDVTIESNLVMGCDSGVIFTVDAGTGAVIRSNTFVASADQPNRRGIYNIAGAPLATWDSKNNVLVGFETGILAQSLAATTNSNNAFWRCSGNYGGSATGGSDVVTDPLLSAAYVPLPGSPLLSGGADLGYRRDIRGFQSRKHIGAFGRATFMEQR